MQSVVVVSIRTGFRYRASPEASPNPKNAPAGFAGSRDVAIEADGQGEQLSRREQPRSREGGGQRGPDLSAATLPRTSVDGDRGHHPRRRANLAPSHITCVCPDTQSPRAPMGDRPVPAQSQLELESGECFSTSTSSTSTKDQCPITDNNNQFIRTYARLSHTHRNSENTRQQQPLGSWTAKIDSRIPLCRRTDRTPWRHPPHQTHRRGYHSRRCRRKTSRRLRLRLKFPGLRI